MKIQGISRPSGGVVIKLKAKEINRKRLIETVVLSAIVLVVCFVMYYFVDYIWNGSFVDWFQDNYTWTQMKTDGLSGQNMLVTEINWPKFKILIMGVVCAGAVVCLLLVRGISTFYGRKMMEQAVTKSSQMIHSFMEHEIEADLVFPPEYAQLAVQMSQIKSKIERNTRVIKEEEKRKNDMITYLAHDLKTPLTSIIGYLSMLDEAKDMPQAQREKYTRIVFDKSLQLEGLIQEFFDITRYNLNQIVLEKETLDLSYMLVQLADEFYPILQQGDNYIELEIGQEILVYGDAVKLARVFQNVLKNAVAYSYPGTAVVIRTETDGDEVKIYIQNRGKTIPKEKLPYIFNKFYRTDEARSGNTGGAGLGLAIAREIVILHEGDICAESEGEVTTFIMRIPCL